MITVAPCPAVVASGTLMGERGGRGASEWRRVRAGFATVDARDERLVLSWFGPEPAMAEKGRLSADGEVGCGESASQ